LEATMACRHYRDPDRRGYLWAVGRGSLHSDLQRPVRTYEVAVQELCGDDPTEGGYVALCSEWQARVEADDPPPTIDTEAWRTVRTLVADALAWPIASDENTPEPGARLLAGEWPASRSAQLSMML